MMIREIPMSSLEKICAVVTWSIRGAMILLTIAYIANVAVTFIDPTAVMIGKTTRTEWIEDGMPKKSVSRIGIIRFFVSSSDSNESGLLTLGNSKIPLANMTPATWTIFNVYLTALFAVTATFLTLLSSLFSRFSNGQAFTKKSVENIKWIGYSLIAAASIAFAGSITTAFIYRFLNHSVNFGESRIAYDMSLPTLLAFAGVIITIIAMVFEEGRKTHDDAALTI